MCVCVLACSRHLILSPGATITVVKTPANIPARNVCVELKHRNWGEESELTLKVEVKADELEMFYSR